MAHRSDSPIFLVGYRGTGKTSVASKLAAQLSLEWVDADDVVERDAGKTIAAIFADGGEEVFRDWEARAVAELSGRRRTVVALGGGAVLREENRRAICGAGPVIWLTASVETILARVAACSTSASRRPNLTTAGGRAEIEALLAVRTPLYEQCATLVVDTEGKTPTEVADEIAASL